VQAALTVYRAAVETDGSAEMKQRIEDRIQVLSGSSAPMTESAAGSESYAVVAIRYTPGAAAPQVHFTIEWNGEHRRANRRADSGSAVDGSGCGSGNCDAPGGR